jgi:type II secretory pathway pseudopilin PulG
VPEMHEAREKCMHGILVFLAVIGILALAAIGLYVYSKRKAIVQAEKDAAEQLKHAANTFKNL